jgi:hypothetical protein
MIASGLKAATLDRASARLAAVSIEANPLSLKA